MTSGWQNRLWDLWRAMQPSGQDDRLQVKIMPEDPRFDPAIDGFGQFRVSTPETLVSSWMEYDLQPYLWANKTVGTATITHVPDESAADLAIGTANGDRVVRQLREYQRYQPGKSQKIKATGTFGAQQTGTEKLIGYGDDLNGIFVGQDGGGVFVLLRSSTSGVVSDSRKVYQSSWNVDVMDGTGPSGETLDATKAQIILIDLEWLGVGGIATGSSIISSGNKNNSIPIFGKTFSGKLPFGLDVDGINPVHLALIAWADVGNATASFTFQWEEIH